ncbi:MAG: HEAT repeat domain-containing protein [bacterium]|nr:HEAT repeat domain-containing protein [bacterium]
MNTRYIIRTGTGLLAAIFLVISAGGCGKALVKRSGAKIDNSKVAAAEKKFVSGNWELRLQGIRAISNTPSLETDDKKIANNIEELLLKASQDNHAIIRIEAIEGLVSLSSKKSMKRILDMARYERDDNVRWAAIEGLGKLKKPSAIPIYLIGLNSDDWLIREASIKGVLLMENVPDKQVIIPYIIQSIKDPNITVKITTLNYIDIKDNQIYFAITKIFHDKLDSKNTLLKASLKALKGYILDEKTREKVINLLTHRNKETRILALHVLKEEKILEDKLFEEELLLLEEKKSKEETGL